MKKLAFAIGFLFVALFTQAQNVCGSWSGVLKLNDRELPVVFNVTKSGDLLMATMDSPSQNVKGVSTTSTTFADSILTIRMDDAHMQFEGRLTKNNELKGIFTQMDKCYPLSLTNRRMKATESKPKMVKRRKNTAYSYSFDAVVLADANQTRAIFYQPLNYTKTSAVVLVCDVESGYTPKPNDYPKEFLELSDHLCSNGIAVICIQVQGDDSLVNHALSFLKSCPTVNADKISVVKCSETSVDGTITFPKNSKQVSREISIVDTHKTATFELLTTWLLKIA
jgi:hypothetical protein